MIIISVIAVGVKAQSILTPSFLSTTSHTQQCKYGQKRSLTSGALHGLKSMPNLKRS